MPDLVRISTVHEVDQQNHAYTGIATARIQSDLGFRIPGKITKRFVDVGQAVHASQPLMRIDVTDYAHVITAQSQNGQSTKAKANQATSDEALTAGWSA
ncbi:MAG: hypothetical protein ACJ72H_13095 [Candidatus Sulfotelmatobacter sp.]